MKHLYLAICCLCVGLISQAQFNKGQRMIGGQLNFTANNAQSNATLIDNTSFGLDLSFSKFIKPTSFYTVGVNFSNTSTPKTFQNNSYGIQFQYTILQHLIKKFYLGYTGSFNSYINNSNYYNGIGTLVSKTNGWNIQANGNVGLYFQLNNRFLLYTNLINFVTVRYSNQSDQNLDANNNFIKSNANSSYSFNTGLTGFSLNNLGIGVKYLLK